MENSEIKTECEKLYEEIKAAKTKLNELRSKCKHEKTHIGNYSWRVGAISEAEICDFCGALIDF